MFDIGFTEILLIGVVALIVIGPERLPHAARMTGAFIGKIRRTFSTIQVEMEQQVTDSQIREQLKEQAEKAGLADIVHSINDSAKSDSATSEISESDNSANDNPANDNPAKKDDAKNVSTDSKTEND